MTILEQPDGWYVYGPIDLKPFVENVEQHIRDTWHREPNGPVRCSPAGTCLGRFSTRDEARAFVEQRR